MTSEGTAAPSGAPGSQTLARGLAALQLVAASRTGLTVQQVAQAVGVAAEDRIFAGAVMGHQGLHVTLEELIGGVLKAGQF